MILLPALFTQFTESIIIKTRDIYIKQRHDYIMALFDISEYKGRFKFISKNIFSQIKMSTQIFYAYFNLPNVKIKL